MESTVPNELAKKPPTLASLIPRRDSDNVSMVPFRPPSVLDTEAGMKEYLHQLSFSDKQGQEFANYLPTLLPEIGKKYILEKDIGSGVYSVAFTARPKDKSGSSLVIKILRPDLTPDQNQKFSDEIYTLKSLYSRLDEDANLIPEVVEFGRNKLDKPLYFVMTMAEGIRSDSYLDRGGTLTLPETLDVLSQQFRVIVALRKMNKFYDDPQLQNTFIKRDNGQVNITMVDFNEVKNVSAPQNLTPTDPHGEFQGSALKLKLSEAEEYLSKSISRYGTVPVQRLAILVQAGKDHPYEFIKNIDTIMEIVENIDVLGAKASRDSLLDVRVGRYQTLWEKLGELGLGDIKKEIDIRWRLEHNPVRDNQIKAYDDLVGLPYGAQLVTQLELDKVREEVIHGQENQMIEKVISEVLNSLNAKNLVRVVNALLKYDPGRKSMLQEWVKTNRPEFYNDVTKAVDDFDHGINRIYQYDIIVPTQAKSASAYYPDQLLTARSLMQQAPDQYPPKRLLLDLIERTIKGEIRPPPQDMLDALRDANPFSCKILLEKLKIAKPEQGKLFDPDGPYYFITTYINVQFGKLLAGEE